MATLEINGEDFSARWGSLTEEQIDQITDYVETLVGRPDTVV